jgi:CRP-like cAMP-binding protein
LSEFVLTTVGSAPRLRSLLTSQGFDDRCLGIIASYLRPATFAIDETIYERGDRGNEMFFVVDGTVVVHADSSCSPADKPAVLEDDESDNAAKVVCKGIVTKGDVFGEGGLFPAELGPCRRESVSALTWVSAYTLNSSALHEISAEYPEVRCHTKFRRLIFLMDCYIAITNKIN